MKLVPMYFARLPDPLRPGRFYRTRHRMLLEDIERREGVAIERDVELREVATTEDEMRQRMNTRPGAFGRNRPI